MNADHHRKQRIAEHLEDVVDAAGDLAEKLGLVPYPVDYWVVDHDEMNELIAYDGFQTRYPHWRWGMKYDRQRKQDAFLGGKAFEIVNNDSPANAFLQESNSMADQKAVITHVEAHADFFANNRWFRLFSEDPAGRGDAAGPAGPTDGDRTPPGGDPGTASQGPDAAAMLERHAERIRDVVEDPEIDREDVERFVDAVLAVEDTIDQHAPFVRDPDLDAGDEAGDEDLPVDLDALDVSDDVRGQVFDDEWLERHRKSTGDHEPVADVLAYLKAHGMQYDSERERAVEFEDWQREVLEILRTEAYYFAPQRMTKVMNEGWASFWESIMMTGENFADDDEFVEYADHMARVLGAPGLNPYKLGRELWEYVENTENRRKVIERLLRVEGVTWRNFHDAVDFQRVQALLAPDDLLSSVPADDPERLLDLPDETIDRDAVEAAIEGGEDAPDLGRHPWRALSYRGLAERHYSLSRPENRGVVRRVSQAELERVARYLFDDDRYPDEATALSDLDYAAGWDRLFEVRESHNDVTFVDQFLTDEFVDEHDYFAYEYSRATGDYRATSSDAASVKKKLLLEFTNFGKPTVEVLDGNFRNRNELLLGHRYNGVALDLEQARHTLERVFELWGRPVALKTIVKRVDDHDRKVAQRRNEEPEPEEVGLLVRYDGEAFEETELDPEDVEDVAADDVDYDTKPDEWLA
ncbi:MAG: SpoVR family protein [Halobacteriales archaeon]